MMTNPDDSDRRTALDDHHRMYDAAAAIHSEHGHRNHPRVTIRVPTHGRDHVLSGRVERTKAIHPQRHPVHPPSRPPRHRPRTP